MDGQTHTWSDGQPKNIMPTVGRGKNIWLLSRYSLTKLVYRIDTQTDSQPENMMPTSGLRHNDFILDYCSNCDHDGLEQNSSNFFW